MFHELKVSPALLNQIIYALERRLVELNNRGSEPVAGAIAETASALEYAISVSGAFIDAA